MPLLGQAAMLLLFDVVADAIAEHDEWHTHEHLPERLALPGFRRGTRWVATDGQPRYFVMYEVDELATLVSDAYLDRLNHPSPWTTRMMASYRGMTRGFCSVAGSFGVGAGNAALLIRFDPADDTRASLRDWLLEATLPPIPERPGIGGAHLLVGAATPPMTSEQRIRGTDARIGWTLLVTGYDEAVLASLGRSELGNSALEARGAADVHARMYRMAYSVIDREVAT